MTTLAQLIEHYCPNGVAYVKLGELEDRGDVKLGRGKVISKTTMSENPGDHPVYSSSASANGLFGTYGDYMFDDERITWSVDGGGKFFYRPAHKYSVTNVCGWMKTTSGSVTTKYLYYALYQLWTGEVFDYTRKAHPSVIRDVYQIPFPPREVQDAIVERLDAFAALIESLDSEITLREKRFEYFREQLLTFDDSAGVEYVKLGDVAEIARKTCQPERMGTGSVVLYSLPGFDEGAPERLDPTEIKSGKIILSEPSLLVPKLNPRKPRVWLVKAPSPRSYCSTEFFPIQADNSSLSLRYLYYVICDTISELAFLVDGGSNSHKRLNRDIYLDLLIPLPAREVQDAIVDKLDTLQALIDNLKQERELRKSQFEYYREKLLTFNS